MKAIIIDDESLALEYLSNQLNKNSSIKILGEFVSFDTKDYIDLLKEIDIAFLDIEMPEISGLELAEQILEINPSVIIVFITAFNEYAVQAFELNALDYLLKPVQSDRLKKTLERIINQANSSEKLLIPAEESLQINLCEDLSFNLPNDSQYNVQWRTTKSKELFLYLLHNAEKINRKSELIDLLWPDFDSEKAYSQLYTAIYHVRKSLKQFGSHFSLKSMQEGYILFTNDLYIDIVEWESSLSLLPLLKSDTIHQYENLMEFYTGGYLSKMDYSWTEPEKYRLEKLWTKVAYDIAHYYEEQLDTENAEDWYVKIVAAKPEEEQAHFALMKIYATLGLGLLVEHQYKQLQKTLEELDSVVNLRIKEWYDVWETSK